MLKQALVEGINPLGEFLFFKLQVFAPYINRTNRFDRKCLMDPPFVYLYMRQMSESKQSFKGFSLVNSCFDMYIYISWMLTREFIERIPLLNSCCGTQGLRSLTCIYNMLILQGPGDFF